jgi:hypothetical protein
MTSCTINESIFWPASSAFLPGQWRHFLTTHILGWTLFLLTSISSLAVAPIFLHLPSQRSRTESSTLYLYVPTPR